MRCSSDSRTYVWVSQCSVFDKDCAGCDGGFATFCLRVDRGVSQIVRGSIESLSPYHTRAKAGGGAAGAQVDVCLANAEPFEFHSVFRKAATEDMDGVVHPAADKSHFRAVSRLGERTSTILWRRSLRSWRAPLGMCPVMMGSSKAAGSSADVSAGTISTSDPASANGSIIMGVLRRTHRERKDRCYAIDHVHPGRGKPCERH